MFQICIRLKQNHRDLTTKRMWIICLLEFYAKTNLCCNTYPLFKESTNSICKILIVWALEECYFSSYVQCKKIPVCRQNIRVI